MGARVGLIGAGIMGADHARILSSGIGGAVLAAVHDADSARARQVADACGGTQLYDDPQALIADAGIDAVLVASPDETHAALVLACIAQGKPVLVEKPLAATLDECRAIVAAETRGGRRLVQVGYMRRFDPGYRMMKAALAEGRLGPPLFLHCVHRNAVAPHWLTNELVIANSATHEIDIARYLLGEEFASVSVISPRASSRAPTRQPQLIVLETASGVVVDVEAFVDAQYGYDVRAELVCENGTVALAPNPPLATRLAGQDSHALHADWRGRFADAYRDQIGAWLVSLGTDRPAGSSAWDGYAASVTADAALQAWRTRSRTPVQLDTMPEFYRNA